MLLENCMIDGRIDTSLKQSIIVNLILTLARRHCMSVAYIIFLTSEYGSEVRQSLAKSILRVVKYNAVSL